MPDPRYLIKIADKGFPLMETDEAADLSDLVTDEVAVECQPGPDDKNADFEATELRQYEGTLFVQWFGRFAGGDFHPWGALMQINQGERPE